MNASEAGDAFVERLLGDFVDEAGQLVRRLNDHLLRLDECVQLRGFHGGEPRDRELLNEMFRAAHSLKSLSAMLGLKSISQLAHGIENVFDAARQQELVLGSDGVELLFQALDRLEASIQALKNPQGGPVECQAVLAGLQNLPASSRKSKETGNESIGKSAATEPALTALPDSLGPKAGGAATADLPIWVGAIRFRPGLPLAGLKARLIFEKLAHLGTVCFFEPPCDQLEHKEDLAVVRFGLSTSRSRREILGHVRVAGIEAISLEPLGPQCAKADDARTSTSPASPVEDRGESASVPGESTPVSPPQHQGLTGQEDARAFGASGSASLAPKPASRLAEASSTESVCPAETLRVEIKRLDQLMSLAGQLVLNKARLAQIAERLRETLGGRHLLRSLKEARSALARLLLDEGPALSAEAKVEALRREAWRVDEALESVRAHLACWSQLCTHAGDLADAIQQLDRLAEAIQQSVMQARMVPIGPLFARFKRLLRDITQSSGKAIRLVIKGEKTELDKRMIDELADPLVHLVRNAAAHGIEPPAERVAAGKPTEGTVTLEAFHRGNRIVIRVRDDGRGLDAQRILRKALEKGLVAPAQGERLTRAQIYDLIWLPGLSTAETVTEVSGRGMGMDIVKAKIKQLKGTVGIESVPGAGTTLTITLPLTLATLPSLMVEVQGETFAVPMEAVREIVALSSCQMGTVHGRRAAAVRGRMIAVVRLDEALAWTTPPHRPAAPPPGLPHLVLVGEGRDEAALEVDRVLGEADVVIQSLADNCRPVPGVAGATILGNGRVALILDVAALLERVAGRAGGAAGMDAETPTGPAVRPSVSGARPAGQAGRCPIKAAAPLTRLAPWPP